MFEKDMDSIPEEDVQYPLVPMFDERYGCVVITYATENEKAHLETLLNLEPVKAYNKKHIQTSYVLSFEQFKKKWDERN
jgi:hypothetical protein